MSAESIFFYMMLTGLMLAPVAPHLGDVQLLVNVAINESQTSKITDNPNQAASLASYAFAGQAKRFFKEVVGAVREALRRTPDIERAKAMLNAPVELIDGVEETLSRLAQVYPLMMITKGDTFEQSGFESLRTGSHLLL